MRTGRPAVNPDPALIIHGAKMEVYALPAHRDGQLELAAIPDVFHDTVMAHPRELALRAERHGDFGREVLARHEPARRAIVLVVNLELPFAVQRGPVFAQGIRARSLRARHRRKEPAAAT